MVRDRVAMLMDLLVVAGFRGAQGVPGALLVQEFLEVLEAPVPSFHLVLDNLHSREVHHHSWVLTLSMDLRS